MDNEIQTILSYEKPKYNMTTKVEAIKALRAHLFGLSLSEAKEIIEYIEREFRKAR